MFFGMLGSVVIVAIVMYAVYQIVKMSLRHDENVKRIKHGYPTLDGATPLNGYTPEETHHEHPPQYSN